MLCVFVCVRSSRSTPTASPNPAPDTEGASCAIPWSPWSLSTNPQASEYASEYGAHGAGERESHMSKRSRPGKCI